MNKNNKNKKKLVKTHLAKTQIKSSFNLFTSLEALCGFTICNEFPCLTKSACESPTQPTYNFFSIGRYKAQQAVVPLLKF